MLAPLQYAERSRRRPALLGTAVIAVVTALCGYLLTPGGVATVLVSAGPPYPAQTGSGTDAQSLPEQDGPHDRQEWTPWTLLAVSTDDRTITVGWTSAGTNCEGRPVAMHVEQDAQTVRIGLISPTGTDRLCAASVIGGPYRVELAEPAYAVAIYRVGA